MTGKWKRLDESLSWEAAVRSQTGMIGARIDPAKIVISDSGNVHVKKRAACEAKP